MKTLVRLLAVAIALTSFGFAQNGAPPFNPQFSNNVGGMFVASEYGKWTLQSLTTSTSTGSYSMTLNPCYVNVGTGNKRVFPIAINVPVTIIDGTQTETVTPTGVSVPSPALGPSTGPNPYACSFTATFTYAHNAGVFIVSGDSGLEEAINDALVTGGGGGSAGSSVVILDSSFGGTTSTLTTALVYPTVQIVDMRKPTLQYWNPQPSSASVISAPTVRAAVATCPSPLLATTVCNNASTGGTWPNSAEYVCVTYIDAMGGESPCSTTAHFTSGGTTSTIYFSAPVASTGAVGWRAYAGLAYLTTAYQLPITSANCTLTTIETVVPACAVTNALYGQVGSAAVFTTPVVTTSLVPQAGGVGGAYNPNPISHQSFAYAPAPRPYVGFEQNFNAFPTTVALTGGQAAVLGNLTLPAALLNYIGTTLHISGNISLTPTTGGTIQILTSIGDITDFTTGTPKAVCTDTETTATGTAAIKVHFDCTWTVNATGTTGSIMPGGFMLEQLQAGTTTGNLAVESATAVITTDVLDQDTIFVNFLQTTAAETGGVQLIDLHVEVL